MAHKPVGLVTSGGKVFNTPGLLSGVLPPVVQGVVNVDGVFVIHDVAKALGVSGMQGPTNSGVLANAVSSISEVENHIVNEIQGQLSSRPSTATFEMDDAIFGSFTEFIDACRKSEFSHRAISLWESTLSKIVATKEEELRRTDPTARIHKGAPYYNVGLLHFAAGNFDDAFRYFVESGERSIKFLRIMRMGGMKKGPSEGGSGGKRGHSNMEHWGYNDEVKQAARSRRRLDGKKTVAEAKQLGGVADTEARLRVSFDNPKHGWIGIKVSAGEHEFSESVSYTPNDFPLQLASAVSLTLQGQVGVAAAHTEPLWYDFVFTPKRDTGTIALEIVEYLSFRRKGGKSVLSFEAQATKIARPFYKALRDIETRLPVGEYQQAMRTDFPTAAVKRLGEHIQND